MVAMTMPMPRSRRLRLSSQATSHPFSQPASQPASHMDTSPSSVDVDGDDTFFSTFGGRDNRRGCGRAKWLTQATGNLRILKAKVHVKCVRRHRPGALGRVHAWGRGRLPAMCTANYEVLCQCGRRCHDPIHVQCSHCNPWR